MRTPPMPPHGSPRPPHPTALRVGEAERDQVVERIKTAFAEGRLDAAEFDMRTHLALTARTRGDLDAILADLQPVPVHPPVHPWPPLRRPNADERAWAMVAHWSPFVLSLVGPLVVLVAKGKTSPYIRHQAVEALNFQLTFLIALLVLPFTVVGVVLYPFLAILWLVLVCAGGISALTGDGFRYPWTIRLVR